MSMLFILNYTKMKLDQDLETEFVPSKLMIDSKVSSKNLEMIESLTIEENDSIILSDITSIDINHNNQLILTNEADRSAILYDYFNVKFIKSIRPSKAFADSIAYTDEKPILIAGKQLRYMKSSEYRLKGLTDLGINMIKSTYFKTYCYENKISILCLVYLPATSDNEDFNAMDNRTILLEFNDNLEYEKFIILEVNKKTYPVPFVLTKMTNGDIITCAPNLNYKKSTYDSIVTLSLHNKEGKFLSNIGFLPEKFIKNKLKYLGNWTPFVTNIHDNLFILYPLDTDVYNTNQEFCFNLKNLPFNNDSSLIYFRNNFKNIVTKEGMVDNRILSKLFPQQIVYTFNANNKLCIIIQVNEDFNSKYYIVQEYELDGTLLSQTIINDNPVNQIRNFVFDKYNGYICLIKKNSLGWSLEKRKWL